MALLSACGAERTKLPARDDATPVLRVPAVATVIRAYMERNQAHKLGLFYIDAVRHGDSTRLTISSLIYRSEAEQLAPCGVIRLNGHWVLVKAHNCAPAVPLDSLLRQVPDILLDRRKKTWKYRVEPDGDTMFFLPEDVFYHPDKLSVLVYKNRVILMQELGSG